MFFGQRGTFWKDGGVEEGGGEGGSVDGVATVPCSQRAESFGGFKKEKKKPKRKMLCKPQRPLLGVWVNAQGPLQHWDRWGALEGLLGWIVVERRRHVWPLLQLVVLQVEILHGSTAVEDTALVSSVKV